MCVGQARAVGERGTQRADLVLERARIEQVLVEVSLEPAESAIGLLRLQARRAIQRCTQARRLPGKLLADHLSLCADLLRNGWARFGEAALADGLRNEQ